jgi:hypothetical protein
VTPSISKPATASDQPALADIDLTLIRESDSADLERWPLSASLISHASLIRGQVAAVQLRGPKGRRPWTARLTPRASAKS